MRFHSDVLIIGGGAIGLTTALELARVGCSVQVIDRGALGAEASWAGAGIIPPGNVANAQTPYDRLRAMSSEAFPGFSADLRELTGIDNGFRPCGGVEFFEGDADAVTRLWELEGISFEQADAESFEAVEPSLAAPSVGYLLPGMGQVRNPWHVRALVAACERCGVRFGADRPAAQLERQGDRVEAVRLENGERRTAGQYLVASGAWSDQLLMPLGVSLGVFPVLGQIVLFRADTRPIRRIVSVGKRYLVPRDDGLVLAGATEEPEAGFEKRNTPSGVQGLIDFAIGLVPALREAAIEKTWSGLRPGTQDGLPYLGAAPGFTNLFVAAGHFRAGIQLSPGTARVMAELMTGRAVSVDLSAFRPGRPTAAPVQTAFRS